MQKGLNSEVIKTNYLSCFESYVILLEKTFIQHKEWYIKDIRCKKRYFGYERAVKYCSSVTASASFSFVS